MPPTRLNLVMLKLVSVAQVEWLQPYTDAKIKELGASGVKQLLAVPISFVSEHIETLEEIDMEYRELAIESGVKVRPSIPSAELIGSNSSLFSMSSSTVSTALHKALEAWYHNALRSWSTEKLAW